MFVIRENLSVFDNDMKLTASLVGGRRLLFKTKKIKDYNGMEKNRTIDSAERQTYVPASVEVIEVTAHEVLCYSGGTYNNPFEDTPESI